MPYRNVEGKVSLALLRHSKAQVVAGTIKAPDAVVELLSKWLGWAERCNQAVLSAGEAGREALGAPAKKQ